MIAPIGNRAAVALVAGFFAFFFAVRWIGETFGNFYGWCTVIVAGWLVLEYSERHGDDE
jgi:hypothetical protein